MTDPVFQICFAVEPAPEHPDHETHGEARAVCWIQAPDLEAAEAAVLAALAEEQWSVLGREFGDAVAREDLDDEELIEYFEQAQAGQEVFLFHTSPRFPVLHVSASVRKGDDEGEAHYLVSADAVAADEDEPFDPAFWSEARRQQAIGEARRLIAEADWETTAITRSEPVCYRGTEDDLKSYYEHAEEDGTCMVFVLSGSGPGSTQGMDPEAP